MTKKDKKILNEEAPTTEACYLTLLSLEVHVTTRADLTPDPNVDSIGFVCYTVFNQTPEHRNLCDETRHENYLIVFDSERRSMVSTRYLALDTAFSLGKRFKSVKYVHKEEELLELFATEMLRIDPDVVVGFEIQKLSWSYLVRRAIKLKVNEFISQISRLPKAKRESLLRLGISKKGEGKADPVLCVPQDLVIAGRVVLNLWRILRSEIALNIYTFENCCFQILKERTLVSSLTPLKFK